MEEDLDSTLEISSFVKQKMGDPRKPPNEFMIMARVKCKNFNFDTTRIHMPNIFKTLLHFHVDPYIEYHVAALHFWFIRLFFVTYFLEESEQERIKKDRVNVTLLDDVEDGKRRRMEEKEEVEEEDFEIVDDVVFNPTTYRVEFTKLLTTYRKSVMKILDCANVRTRQVAHLKETEVFFMKAFVLYNATRSKRIFDDEITRAMKYDYSDMCTVYKEY